MIFYRDADRSPYLNDKRPTADKQDIAGVDLNTILIGVFAAALGGNIGDRSL